MSWAFCHTPAAPSPAINGHQSVPLHGGQLAPICQRDFYVRTAAPVPVRLHQLFIREHA